MNRFQVLLVHIACMVTMNQCLSVIPTESDPSCSGSFKLIEELKREVGAIKAIIKEKMAGFEEKIRTGIGEAVYIRWGHTQCPTSAKLVYSGYAGGSNYNRTGGASNYICLPQNPTSPNDSDWFGGTGKVYGAEYLIPNKGEIKGPCHYFGVPCAVCQSVSRPNMFMLPGRDICPKGWHQEYRGQLMAGRCEHTSSSEYVCVDVSKVKITEVDIIKNGKLFYPVAAVCGSLMCPPYRNNQLLSCTVCTR